MRGALCFRSIESEQQPVIYDRRVIDTVWVHNHRTDHSAELDQVVPIATIAGQAGRLDAEYCANLATAHFGDQSLKPGTLHQPGPRAAQIFVNYSDLLKAQLTGSIREAILPPLAFVVVHHLTWGGLTDVNNRPPTGSINR
jgi:hypothetical protein